MQENHRFGTGCVPSVMDGTERVVTPDDKIPMPEEWSWLRLMPPVRNQGDKQTCVCQSLTGMLDFVTNLKTGDVRKCNNFSIDELYAQRSDKKLEGMTFKDALHYLRHHGLSGEKIEGYARILDAAAIKYAIIMFGPVACGLPVFNTGSKFWQQPGRSRGGHAVVLVGFNRNGYIVRNSWGEQWADNGYTEISYKDFNENCFECWTFLP